MVLGNSQEDIYQSKRHFLICFEDSDLNCIYQEKNPLPSMLKNKIYHVKIEIAKITLVLFVLYFLNTEKRMNEPPILNTKAFLTQNTYTYTLT